MRTTLTLDDNIDDNISEKIRLVVQADDMGMCHAVNEGIVRAFNEGIVTQAAIMAPCPWFDDTLV